MGSSALSPSAGYSVEPGPRSARTERSAPAREPAEARVTGRAPELSESAVAQGTVGVGAGGSVGVGGGGAGTGTVGTVTVGGGGAGTGDVTVGTGTGVVTLTVGSGGTCALPTWTSTCAAAKPPIATIRPSSLPNRFISRRPPDRDVCNYNAPTTA